MIYKGPVLSKGCTALCQSF
uniref:Uncharacterized protein n=1 Tax=Anguilla anguilla TaxID=7936 RepID=A0A0E9VH52_ANGAN